MTDTQKIDRTRVMLLSKAKDIPLMWKVLANKYRDDFAFANHRDRKGKSSVALGYEAGTKKESKILIYPAGSTKPVLFEGTRSLLPLVPLYRMTAHVSAGTLKYDSISKFFDSILDGTVNLSSPSSQAQEETYEPTPEEEEIERKQEAQRLELLHGGFSSMIDFEEALKKHGPDFHGTDSYGVSLGDKPKKVEKTDSEEDAQDEYEREEDPIFKAIRIQRGKEQEKKEALKGCTAKADDAEQVVLEMCTAADTNDFATGTEATRESPSSEEPDSDNESEGMPGPEKAASSYAEHIKDEL
jgi:protein disulfide-isomerase A6